MTNARPFPFHQSIRSFDRALERRLLDRLSLEDADRMLYEISMFHHQALRFRQMETLGLTDETEADAPYLIAAGCRLSSDLNDEVMTRLMDMMQEREAAIETLSAQLREKLQERYKALSLIKKAQELRVMTGNTSEQSGLGMIL